MRRVHRRDGRGSDGLGHSERRGEFGLPTPAESPKLLATKLEYALSKGLNAVFCIGETLEVREKGIDAVMAELVKQLVDVKDLLNPAKVVVAYEPVWSIGTGVTATPEQAQETHAAIRKWIGANCKPGVAEAIRIQCAARPSADFRQTRLPHARISRGACTHR